MAKRKVHFRGYLAGIWVLCGHGKAIWDPHTGDEPVLHTDKVAQPGRVRAHLRGLLLEPAPCAARGVFRTSQTTMEEVMDLLRMVAGVCAIIWFVAQHVRLYRLLKEMKSDNRN